MSDRPVLRVAQFRVAIRLQLHQVGQVHQAPPGEDVFRVGVDFAGYVADAGLRGEA